MTQYGDGQGAAGQPPRHAQYERQAWGGDRPRLGQQYGGEPTYGQQPYGQRPQQQPPGPRAQPIPPWEEQQYDRLPYRDPNSPYSSSYQSGYRLDPGPNRKLGVPGLVVTIIGAVLLLLSFTVLNWYHDVSGDSFGSGGSSGKFNNIHSSINTLHDQLSANPAVSGDYSFGISVTYFSWLGWVLLAVAIVAALISVLPTPATPVMRAISVLAGLGGAGLTVWAADLFSVTGPLKDAVQTQFGFSPTFSFWLKHSYLGAWFAIGGFVIVAFGGLLGSARRR